ncbi:MAG: hypothetical protein V4793_07840 [Paraburkholderia tropica]|uniref:Uncharacterized protein n=1 Tax=Paraburkholderia tropica TaxID=92647 RepID=A0AAQ1GAW6_9BURK|nr:MULTISPECIES: hypothetical protein [Paraburkholderia]MDE1139343.1 hypothetical protein [Paraburkholderia tropica]PXX19789.1 hypothetical protein C7400_102214 [Paraburkholderia tropica]PZW88730.1 hypothetical protein C7399_102214 [Paraburkholderia tropica]SEI86094.1 hypothetical protein SAMN05216550_101207 [Paraburkholderia tropica]
MRFGQARNGITGTSGITATDTRKRTRPLRRQVAAWLLFAFGAVFGTLGTFGAASSARAADWCGAGLWVDAMVGSYHIHPDKDFEQFNPGLGIECWPSDTWALTAGGFRNSLRRPSWYGGAVWAPEFLHWGFVRLAAMGGIISGYNYGNWGLGRNHTVGPVVAPIVMVAYKRVGVNFIVIPPIPSDDLPFTVGFQLRFKF